MNFVNRIKLWVNNITLLFVIILTLLVTGDFIQEALLTKLNLFERLSDVLCGGKVKLLVTPCTLIVLKALGDEYFGAFVQAKRRFDLVRTHCSHSDLSVEDLLKETKEDTVKIPSNMHASQKDRLLKFSADCLLDMFTSTKNKCHYMVASQYERLLRKCRKLTGIPTIHIYRNVVILDPLPESAKESQKDDEVKKSLPTDQEKSIIKKIVPIEKKKRTQLASKKRKVKGPNPLSMKKKKSVTAKASPTTRRDALRTPQESTT